MDRILQLGRMTTEGLGAGSRAEIGKAAAEESLAEIEDMLEGAHMCFVAAGMGGGTGTGAAPVIAEAARAKGILTVGVATKPFAFEGRRRAAVAEAGLEELEKHVDTLIVIPNQNLFRVASPATTFKAAFDLADDVLQQGVRGITDLMVLPGLINLDFADVRTIMANPGKAMMGTGEASGDDRAMRAAEQAIANPLLDEAMKGASGLIISITGGDDMLLMEVDEVASHIKALVDPDADIIWGSAFDPEPGRADPGLGGRDRHRRRRGRGGRCPDPADRRRPFARSRRRPSPPRRSARPRRSSRPRSRRPSRWRCRCRRPRPQWTRTNCCSPSSAS